ncbi:MAG: pyridoxamine 5'-phosphate oxidase family protein [Pseudomonadota bacterium]
MAESRIDALREELGGAHPLAANKVAQQLNDHQIGFIRNAPFMVMASSNDKGDCDASPKGGHPGFVKVLDPETLLIPDIGGNRLFQSFANFESNPKAGLVFFIPGIDVTVRVNGRIEVLEASAVEAEGVNAEVHHPDDNAAIVQGLRLTVDEAYFHCPRSMHFGEVWNEAAIAINRERSLAELK